MCSVCMASAGARFFARRGCALALAFALVCLIAPRAAAQTGCTGSGCGSSRIYVLTAHLGSSAVCGNLGGSAPEVIDPQTGSVADPGAPWGISASAVPNGAWLLLTQCGGATDVASANGTGGLTPVPKGQSVDPTGQFVAFVGQSGDISVAQVGSSAAPADLGVPGSDPRFSPDGTLIAFLSANGDLSVIRQDGTGLRMLIPSSQTGGNPVYNWFADSARLAVLTQQSQSNCNGFRAESFEEVDTTSAAVSAHPLNVSACPSGSSGAWFLAQDIAPSPDGTLVAIAGAFSQCSPAQGTPPGCGGGELGSAGLFFQGQLGTVPATGGDLTVIKKLPGECTDPANTSCVDPSGGQLAPAGTGPSYQPHTLRWGGSAKLPVVLVTGLADSHGSLTPGQSCTPTVTGSMTALCDALQSAGFPVYVPDSRAGPGAVLDNRLGFGVNAQSLENYLFTVVKRPALLVGHSMGGIFSRIAISRDGAQEDGLFTISSPMDGSFGADIAVGAANFPCTPLIACSALRAAGAYALSRFGPAAMQDLTAAARLWDNARLTPPGVKTWTLAGTACRPFGTALQPGLLGYTFPNDGIVGLSSAFGVGANLGPTIRSTVSAYHEAQLQSGLGGICGAAGIELTDSTVIAQVLNAANYLQTVGPAPDAPAHDIPTAGAPAIATATAAKAKAPSLVLPLQLGAVRTLRPNARIQIDPRTSLFSRSAFSIVCGHRTLPALPAIGDRVWGFPTGALTCRTAVLKSQRRLTIGIASDPQKVTLTVTSSRQGYQLTVTSASAITTVRLTHGNKVVRRPLHKAHHTITFTLTAAQASGLTVTATIARQRYAATMPTLG